MKLVKKTNDNDEIQQLTNYLHAQMEIFDQMQQTNGHFLQTVEPLSACLGFIGVRAGYYCAMKLVKLAIDNAPADATSQTELTLSSSDLQLREQLLAATLDFAHEIVSDVTKNNADLNDLSAPADAEEIVEANFSATQDALLGDNDD